MHPKTRLAVSYTHLADIVIVSTVVPFELSFICAWRKLDSSNIPVSYTHLFDFSTTISILIYLPTKYPALYNSSKVSNLDIRPFPSPNGWIHKKSSITHGITNSGAMCVWLIASSYCLHKLSIYSAVRIADRKSTRLNSSHITRSRMPSSA